MGILRSDRVSGLGGANAINGSVKFGDSYLRIAYSTPDDFTFDGDFTIEYWYYPQSTNADSIHLEYAKTTGYKRAWQVHQSHSSNTYAPRFWWWAGGSTTGSMISSITMTPNSWYHIAWVRIGTTLYNYVDGVSGGSSAGTSGITLGNPSDAEKPHQSLNIGVQVYNGPQLMLGGGHISNLRIIKGEGIYTAAFTAPTTRLEKTSNTVLLCCQSPGDVTKEETGKIIQANNIANSAPPQASHFAPDLGEDHGTTFEDNTRFNTLSYMVPPGGTTAQSNRGRAVFGGGESPSADNAMEYINIQSSGRTVDFGDTSIATPGGTAVSSSTRGVFTLWNTPANKNTLEYITIATTSNATDFGDQSVELEQEGSASNATRGLFAGGIVPPSTANATVEYITIATTGNAADFGDLSGARISLEGTADTTRAVFGGGIGPASPWPKLNTMEYFTIATTGNATDFGDMTYGARYPGATGDNTRGVYMGGDTGSMTNQIDYITIQTTANAADFGDLVTASSDIAATSNNIRGIMGAGMTPSITNTIEQLTIATTGNASDFGDLIRAVSQIGVCSDSHGGLS